MMTIVKLESYVYSPEEYVVFKRKMDKFNESRMEKVIHRGYSGGYASVVTREPILCSDTELLYLLKNNISFRCVTSDQ